MWWLKLGIGIGEDRGQARAGQLQTDLKPVLRQKDFEEFDFEQAWKWLKILEKETSKSL